VAGAGSLTAYRQPRNRFPLQWANALEFPRRSHSEWCFCICSPDVTVPFAGWVSAINQAAYRFGGSRPLFAHEGD
ncbi:MAG: hypothetical protein VYA12_02025, partial [Pseudomonadota bacterium]|nr:hypothetical protein [Pseudomonadota bacterium]